MRQQDAKAAPDTAQYAAIGAAQAHIRVEHAVPHHRTHTSHKAHRTSYTHREERRRAPYMASRCAIAVRARNNCTMASKRDGESRPMRPSAPRRRKMKIMRLQASGAKICGGSWSSNWAARRGARGGSEAAQGRCWSRCAASKQRSCGGSSGWWP